MKVLETIGATSRKGQNGVFQYRRSVRGVEVSFIDGRTKSPDFVVDHSDWIKILQALGGAPKISQLTGSGTGGPSRPAYTIRSFIQAASVSNSSTLNVNDQSHLAAVIAVLEHEGSIDVYGGAIGRGKGVAICLRADVAATKATPATPSAPNAPSIAAAPAIVSTTASESDSMVDREVSNPNSESKNLAELLDSDSFEVIQAEE